MRKIIIKSLVLAAVCLQVAMAQNSGTRNMNQDSTNLTPIGMATLPTNQTHTSTYSTVMGACGADNGKALSAAPANLCSAGTPSIVYTNGSSYAWSCTGNYGAASAASCGATVQPKSGFLTVRITAIAQCTGYRPYTQYLTAIIPYTVSGSVGTLRSGVYQRSDFGSDMFAQWGVTGNTISIQAEKLLGFSASIPAGLSFPSLSVGANDGCAG